MIDRYKDKYEEYEKANEIMDHWLDFLVRHIKLETPEMSLPLPEKLRASKRIELLEAYEKIKNG